MTKNNHREILKRSRQKKRRRLAWRLGLSGFILLFLIIGIVAATHLNYFLLKDVRVVGNKLISQDDIIATVNQKLEGNYWFVFPRRNVLFYPRDEIKQALTARFPQLASLSVTPDNLTSLAIKVQERYTAAVWCVSVEQCYLMDQSGLLFSPAPQFSGHLFFVINGELSGDPLGQRPLTATQLTQIMALRTGLDELLAKVAAQPIVIDAAQMYPEGDIDFLGDFTIHLNLDQDPATVLTSARSAFGDKILLAALHDPQTLIDYIDLRFLPKIFYKLKP